MSDNIFSDEDFDDYDDMEDTAAKRAQKKSAALYLRINLKAIPYIPNTGNHKRRFGIYGI